MKTENSRAPWRLLVSLACIAHAAWAGAADESNPILSEQDFFGEVPMVLTVSRLVQPISEAPAAVTVIDRDMIRTSGFRDLADVFRFVPGFYVGLFSGNEQLVSGGLDGRYFGRVQVLLDGKSVYTPISGQVAWSILPVALEDIDRIEVTRGPNAASYGANSVLGVINIITRHPVQDQGTLILTRVGDPALADGLLRHSGKSGDLDYRITLGHKQDHGFEARNDNQRTDTISARADYRIDNQQSLQFQFGYTGGVLGAGYFGSNDVGPSDQQVESSFQQIVWRRATGTDDEMSLQFYRTKYASHETYATSTFQVGPILVLPTVIRTDLDAERYDLEFQRNQRLGPTLRLAWGLNGRLDRVRAPLYLANSDDYVSSRLQRLFFNAEWHPLPDLIVNGGAAWEHNDISGTDLSPRLALSYHVAPGHTLRAGASRALRTPTVLESIGSFSFTVNTSIGQLLIPRFFGNAALQPESIDNRELAYLFDAPSYGFSADVRLYEERIRRVIDYEKVIAPPFDYFVFNNAANVSLRGAQTQARWRSGSTQLNLAHAYTKTVIDAADNPSTAEDLQFSTPSHMLSALLSHRFDTGLEASVAYYYLDNLHPIGDGDDLKSYRRWDARLAYDFRVGGQRGRLAVVGQNLFSPYSEFRTENLFKKRVLTTLSLEF